MIEYVGYCGVRHSELEECIGLPILVMERHSRQNKKGVYELHFGILGRAPASVGDYVSGYTVTTEVDEGGYAKGGLLIGPPPDYMVFVKRPS